MASDAEQWAERNFAFIRDCVQPWLGVTPDGKAGTGSTIPAWWKRMSDLAKAGQPTLRKPSLSDRFTVDLVSRMFPGAKKSDIEQNLFHVLKALEEASLTDDLMVLMALATIRAETGGFKPISEYQSRFNTSPGGRSFDLYDLRSDLGNTGPPDGDSFKGRGFVQLTGRHNYREVGEQIGMAGILESNPDLANRPDIAARILAEFIRRRQAKIWAALKHGDLKKARRIVNGGSHGLEEFTESYNTGLKLLGIDQFEQFGL